MKYPYEDLSDKQFEALIVALCQELLGLGTTPFAQGPDGGRDAKFVGTANHIPSKQHPWNGTAIVQAKHTNGYNMSCSDKEFHSDDSCDTVLGKELPRIKKLRDSGELDHYMLFTNRRLTGSTEASLRSLIALECGLPVASVQIVGIELLDLYLARFPEAVNVAGIDPVDSPLLVSSQELAEVVEGFARNIPEVSTIMDTPPVTRVTYEQKNNLNKMSADYARELRRRYLGDTKQIRAFLAAPENDDLMKRYESVVEDFQLKIISKRKDYQSFDEVFQYLSDLLLNRDAVLRQYKRLTRCMLFYMYWNCDIGIEANAQAL